MSTRSKLTTISTRMNCIFPREGSMPVDYAPPVLRDKLFSALEAPQRNLAENRAFQFQNCTKERDRENALPPDASICAVGENSAGTVLPLSDSRIQRLSGAPGTPSKSAVNRLGLAVGGYTRCYASRSPKPLISDAFLGNSLPYGADGCDALRTKKGYTINTQRACRRPPQ